MAINSKVSTLSTQASGGEEIVRITVRKGNEADFLPSEMLPGELAISTDKGIARYCYSAGKIKVFATREDIYEILGASAEEFEKFQELIEYLKQNENVYDEIIANLNSLEENKQDNLIESLSGASEYVSEAHDGAGIIRKFPGKTYQVKTNGYQLLDESKLPTKTQGGATVTNNDDGSFTVSGSGTLTQSFSSFYTDFDFKKWLKVGNITAKINEFKRPYFLLTAYAGGKAVFTLTPSSANGYTSSHYITEDEFASITNITYGFTGNSGDEILTGTVKPMIYQDGDGTWEPYTGRKPGPNPEYPLKVHGVGDSGYFDGELLQGIISGSTGATTTEQNGLYSKNKIYCKQSDVVSVECENEMDRILIAFYNSSGGFIVASTSDSSAKMFSANAPSEANYFLINVRKTNISPQNAGHITVTINKKYAAIAKSRTLQLFDASKLPTASAGGATVTNNGDGSFTVSGTGNTTSPFNLEYTMSDISFLKLGILELSGASEKVAPVFQIIGYNTDKYSDRTFILANNSPSVNITKDILNKTKNIYCVFYLNTNNKIQPGTIKPMLHQDGDGTWQRFASSEARIPLSQPMYDGDYAYIKDREQVVYRKKGVAVFDGSEDEAWIGNEVLNGYLKVFIDLQNSLVLSNTYMVMCNYFLVEGPEKWTNPTKNACITGISSIAGRLGFTFDGANTVGEWKTWLQSNPITVVYDLATPVEEKITSAEPYTLRAYTPQTRIWTPDELKPEIEVDIPKNLAGGYATDGYAQAMKNQAATAEQEAIKARLLSLEQLAIKEV